MAAVRTPERLVFATKPELGRQILADLHAEQRLPPWVTGDGVYGADPKLRAWLELSEKWDGLANACGGSVV